MGAERRAGGPIGHHRSRCEEVQRLQHRVERRYFRGRRKISSGWRADLQVLEQGKTVGSHIRGRAESWHRDILASGRFQGVGEDLPTGWHLDVEIRWC